jgi:hypothetical protein
MAAKPRGFSQDEPEIFRLASEKSAALNRKITE